MRKLYTNVTRVLSIAFILFCLNSKAQLVVNSNVTALQLVNEIVGPGVTVSNVVLQSANGSAGIFSNGYTTNIGLGSGILLTTGDAADAIGPNSSGDTSKDKDNFTDDPDLDAWTTYSIHDQCILEFDFVAQQSQINVQYVFASEEYNEWVCTQFNDLFGFFVTGPNPLGGNYSSQNVSLVPGTNLPVSINTINNGSAGSNGTASVCEALNYSNYYIYNSANTIGYDGFTVVLTGTLNIVAGQTYHFKFAIADISDGLWDAGIFIKADSFSPYNCHAGNISFAPVPGTLCIDDATSDWVHLNTTSIAPGDNYRFVLTNTSGTILALNTTGNFNMDLYPAGNYNFYGVSYDGSVSGLAVGANIFNLNANPTSGCFEISAPLNLTTINCIPQLNCPGNQTVSCYSAIPSPNPALVSVLSELCPGGLVTWTGDVLSGNTCNGTVTRTYSLTDACGNTGSCSQTFTFNDNVAPVLSNLPSNGSAICGSLPTGASYPVTATDNCDNNVTITSTYVDAGAGCNIQRTITWTATDDCGNTSTDSRTFTTNDTTAPVLGGLPAATTVACASMPVGNDFAVTATDLCDLTPTITSTYVDVASGCNIQRTITWTATDDCGNTSTASRVFTSNDNIAPQLFGVPSDASMQCGQTVPDAVVFATDNCDQDLVVSLTANTVQNACGYSLVRTWSVTDDCGNTTSASQTTTFIDTTNPVLVNLPANGGATCGSLPTGSTYNVSATDNCDNNVAITSTYVDAGAGCNIQRTITWTATDDCGNTSTASRTFTTNDTTAPVLGGLPAATTVACASMPVGNDFAVTATDLCDLTPTITSTYVDVASGCNIQRTITWTATDDCGNTSTASRVFTSNDNIAPQLFGVPSDASMQCGQTVPDAVVFATDNCDQDLVVSLTANTVQNACGYSLVRTWSVTDDCGNTTSASQTTTFIDTTNPVLVNLPANGGATCGSLPTGDSFAVSATDNCDNNVTITSTYADAGAGCNIQRTITWTATDDCGNTSTASRTFTTNDTTAPVLGGLPAATTVACASMPVGNDFAVTATDLCDLTPTITSTYVDVASGCNIQRTITWTATDDCGNTSTASRVFTSNDNIAPQLFGVPSDASMQCGQTVPDAVVFATDNCDQDLVVSLTANTVQNACGYSLVRTWSVTDDCGNTTSASQTTTFIDTTNPVLVNLPANGGATCGSLPTGDSFAVSATDNCDNNVTITSTYADAGAGCNIQRTITWTATDDCGNTSTASRTFTTNDTTAPVLGGLPAATTVACASMPVGNDFAVTATDLCDLTPTITSTYVDVASGCNIQRTITWTATDDCGNTSTASRVFTSNDNIAPQLFGVPSDASMQCGQTVPDAVVFATDNCDQDLVVSLTANTVQNACGYSLVRTWSVTDDCGNTTSASQTTTFIDTTNPVLVNLPANGGATCGSLPTGDSFAVSATDNCDNNVTITSTYVDAGAGCNIQRTITWTATDDCGNTSTASRTFTTNDTTAPVLGGLPAATTVACASMPVGNDFAVTATDLCDLTPTITSTYVDVASGCNIQRTITWTATDDCGNTSTASRVFTSNDNIAPQLFGVPSDASMQCGQTVPDAVVFATDNCDQDLVVSLTANTVQNACGYSLVRTWSVTDDCGNTTSASQTTTFIDTTNPVLVNLPANGGATCGSLPTGDSFAVSATDNCDNNVAITSTYVDAGAGCNIQRTITWTATDDCGNTSTASRTFTTNDTTAPVLGGLPAATTVACASMPVGNDFAVTATDLCDLTPTITSTYVDVASGCNIQRTITWTATDDCGNTSTASRVFTSNDNIAPQLFGVPSDASMQCGQTVPDAVVFATDNCDQDLVVSLTANTVQNACGYSLVRTWSVTDDCGNTTSASQTTTFIDTTNPVLVNLPANGGATCGSLPTGSTYNVSATDNCDNNVTITSTYVDAGAGCNIQRTITWTATDDCGNTSTASRTFTTSDSIDPILVNLPSNGSVLCGGLPSTTEYNVSASDNCDMDVTITVSASDVGTGCNVTRTLTWTATDDCGNSTSATRTFTTQDTIAPILHGIPADATEECGNVVPDAVVFATDNCDTDMTIALSANTIPNACGYTFVRTWTVSDDCGNTSTASQTTTFIDTTDPILHSLPVSGGVECGSIPDETTFNVTATDNCDASVTVEVSFTDLGQGCNMTRTFTWTATDACGNSASATRVFNVYDNTLPTLSGLPVSGTIDCGQMPEGSDYPVIASDNCDLSVTLTSAYTDVQNGCNIVRTITWTATDDCGNVNTAERTFTSNDTVAPILIGVPANTSMECGQSVPDAVVNAIDNCDVQPIVSLSASTVQNPCGYSLIRTWTATDACGNTSTGSQTTTFTDVTSPVFHNLPENSSVQCGSLPEGQIFGVTATDNCDDDVIITSSFTDSGSGCNTIRTITWTATDDCGNSITATRTFTTFDTTDPQLINLPANSTEDCGNMPTAASFGVMGSDNCDNTVTVTSSFVDVVNGCHIERTITWTATDDCGNSSTASRTFTSSDTTAPMLIGVPQDAQMQCGQNVPDAVVSAIDNCDAEPIISLTAQTVQSDCGHTLIRTWTVTDACGNTASASQSTTFIDTIDPVLINLPVSATVPCGNLPSAESFDVQATDNCDDALNIVSQVTDQGAGCNIERTIVWTVTDACGNSSSASRVFTTSDTVDPVLQNLPTDGSVLCGGLPSTTEYNVSATDNCDMDVTITVDASDVGNGCNVTRTLTWTATDDCGNSVSATRTFTTMDNTPPVLIGVPQDAEMQCGQSVPEAVVSAIDNCTTELIVALSANTILNDCGYQLVRTWTVSDDCGNTTTASQTTTFIDTIDPVISNIPDNAIVACGTLPSPEDFDVQVSDNCLQDINLESTYQDQGSGCNMQRVITWTATDVCGNTTSVTRTFGITDEVDPILGGLPENATVACGNLPAVADFNVVATDNCDANVNIESSVQDNVDGCNMVRTITWTATDDCGNSSTASRTFTSSDTTAPMLIGVPQDAQMQCGQNVPDAVVSAIDNCDAEPIISLTAQTVQSDCGHTLIRTWTVTDACGNTASASQSTTFIDTIDPVLVNLPDNGTAGCASLPLASNFDVTVTDNCDDEITLTSEVIDSGVGCNMQRTITWTAVDACGNTATASRVFSMVDTENPVLQNIPENGSVLCGGLPSTTEYNVSASDNCDTEVTVTVDAVDVGSGCNVTRTLTWTATDDCGNSTSATRTFMTQDNTPPVLIGVPQDITLQCGQPVPDAVVVAIDNCSTEPMLALSANTMDLPCGYALVRTWTAVDDCGNTVTATQTTTYQDNEAPVLAGLPENGDFGCGELPNEGTYIVTASDNCSGEVSIAVSMEDTGAGCNAQRTLTWTATDECGNASTATRSFSIADAVAPVLNGLPESGTFPCGNIPNPSDFNVTASDNCAEALTITTAIEDDINGCAVVRTITWNVVDACGNATSESRQFTSVDNIAPIILDVPQDINLQCGQSVPDAVITAIDNCDENLNVILEANTIPGDCGYAFVRTWTVTDNCGNTSIATHTTNFYDNTAPVLIGVPDNAELTCSQLPQGDSFSVTASDNCDQDVEVTVQVTDSGTGCQTVRQIEWIATDACGNTTSEVRTFTSIDITAPQFVSVPANQTITCINLTPAADLVATDNCDNNVEITLVENISTGCPYVITRTWTATDDCGNTTTASQSITVIDNFDPILHNLPQDMTLNCGEVLPVNGVWASDNCDQSIEVVFQETVEEMECLTIISRTWTATDLCGNSTSHLQSIYIVDESAPVFMSPPQNITVSCENLTAAPELVVTDNCDNDVQINFSESIMTSGCPYMLKRIWTATDDCGNSSSVAQIVTVFDNQPPVFADFNPNITLECGDNLPNDPVASDNCGGDVAITFTDINSPEGCTGTLQRTYIATDACGNSITAVRIITFVDTTAPVLLNMPLDLFMQCGDVLPEPAVVLANDNCTSDVTMTYSESQTSQFCPYNVIRVWTATDNCGNTVSGQQVIHVIEPQPAAVYFNAYPNPGRTGKLKIQFSVPDESVAQGALYDISGRLVATLIDGKADGGLVYEWDAQTLNLGPGTYIMTMTVDGEFYKKQFVILDEN